MKMNNRVHRQPFSGHSQRYLDERDARVRAVRDPIIQALYSTPAWRTLRAACLASTGGRCSVTGCRRPAVVADHVIPHRGVSSLFFDLSNLQPLCKPCHDRKTARHDGGFGHRRRPDKPRSPSVRRVTLPRSSVSGDAESGGDHKFASRRSPRGLCPHPNQENVTGARQSELDTGQPPARGVVRVARIGAPTAATPSRHAAPRRVHAPGDTTTRGRSGS
jgi:5-methylcytosine-specific restriction enzyme A